MSHLGLISMIGGFIGLGLGARFLGPVFRRWFWKDK